MKLGIFAEQGNTTAISGIPGYDMIYCEYGKTGAKVSAVGFGGMRFDESKSNEENAQLLLYAQSKGINYFDTAPVYCSDTSEDIFGIALKQMAGNRGSYYVSTKGMPVDLDTADKARAAVEKSMKRLNVDRIDFYHVRRTIRLTTSWRLQSKTSHAFLRPSLISVPLS